MAMLATSDGFQAEVGGEMLGIKVSRHLVGSHTRRRQRALDIFRVFQWL